MSGVGVKENPRRQPSNPSSNNGKPKQPNTQGQNEPRKAPPGKRDNRLSGDGRTGSQKQENVWTARVAQNTKPGAKSETQTTPDDLAQKLSGDLTVTEDRIEGSPDRGPGQRRRNPTRTGSGQKFSQRNPKRESGSHDKEAGERAQSRTFNRETEQPQQEPKAAVDEERGEDIERSTSPGAAGKGKEKVKLSLAEFISTVGGSEDGTESEDEIPSRILWVGNIGSDVTEEELTQEFSAYGKLESLRILHPRFCAFVNFEEEECAKKAKIGLQGTIIGSQYIVIKYRKPETKPATGAIVGTPGSDNSFVLNAPSRALWIGNISDEVTEEDLYLEFSQFGEIESVRLLTHKTCAFVNFMTVDDATNALHALQGRELGNMPIKINFGKPPKRNDNIPYPGAPYMPSFIPQPYYPDYHYPPPYGHPYAAPLPPYIPMEPQYPMYLPPSNMCDFCGVNVKDTAVVPCSHSFCCNECIAKFRATSPDKGAKCVYCQANIEKFVPITFPAMNAYNPYYHPAMVMQDYPPQ